MIRLPAILFPSALITAVAVTSVAAETPEYNGTYESHSTHVLFRDKPCTEAVATIDAPPNPDGLHPAIQSTLRLGFAFGFLLGVDAMYPGIAGDEATLLIRLRKACAETPERPALEILTEFIAEMD